MEKDNRLINIYIKIHNKKTITMEDLQYLAYYDPECFRKTCKNVVYNIPEAEAVMKPEQKTAEETEKETVREAKDTAFDIQKILERLQLLDTDSSIHKDVDSGRVMNLLGNLFMELLFPHNDKEMFIGAPEEEIQGSSFDMKA